MRSLLLACSLLCACSPVLPEESGALDEPAIDVSGDPGKADGFALKMGTYRQTGSSGDLPIQFSLLRTGAALINGLRGRYELGATTLTLSNAQGALLYRLEYAVERNTVEISRASKAVNAQFTRADAASCVTATDCEPQNLSEPTCEGRWACAQATCGFKCFAEDELEPWDPSVGADACARAWAKGLHRCDTQPDEYAVVTKHAHNVASCNRGELVENLYAGLGAYGDKVRQGDQRTPVGTFYVAQKLPLSTYRRALMLSYPAPEDAERGLAAGLISSAERDGIVSAEAHCATPSQHTALGGLVEMHGGGGGIDWTWGCVALKNPSIDRVYDRLQSGDTIIIEP